MDYDFRVLGRAEEETEEGAFLVHMPHPISKDKVKWEKKGSHEHEEMDKLYRDFTWDVKRKFGKTPRLKLCDFM